MFLGYFEEGAIPASGEKWRKEARRHGDTRRYRTHLGTELHPPLSDLEYLSQPGDNLPLNSSIFRPKKTVFTPYYVTATPYGDGTGADRRPRWFPIFRLLTPWPYLVRSGSWTGENEFMACCEGVMPPFWEGSRHLIWPRFRIRLWPSRVLAARGVGSPLSPLAAEISVFGGRGLSTHDHIDRYLTSIRVNVMLPQVLTPPIGGLHG